MKAVRKIMKGPFRKALKLALREVTWSHNEVDQERGWKLLSGGGSISGAKLLAMFEAFNRGEWNKLVAASEMFDQKAARARKREAGRFQDTIESRTIWAEMLVQLGEFSSARPALEGAALAPGGLPDDANLPREVVEHVARTRFPRRCWSKLLGCLPD